MSTKTELSLIRRPEPGSTPESISVSIELPIERHYPDDVGLQHVDQMTVRADGHTVFLDFFEMPPPAIFSQQEAAKLRKSRKPVKATCVSRVAIPQSKFPEFIRAMLQAAGLHR